MEDEEAFVEAAKSGDKDTTGKMGKHEYALLTGTDAYVFIPGPPLSSFYSKLTDQERAGSTAYGSSWYEAAENARLRGVRLSWGYAGKEVSRVLGKPLDKIIEHQMRAIVDSDFSAIAAKGRLLAQSQQDGTSCKITTAGDSILEFQLRGDTEVEDGMINETDVSGGYNMTYLPPGFVSKRLDSASVSGKLKGFVATTPMGVIKDGTLEFESGKLVKWASKLSKRILDKTIESIPAESRLLGLLTIGLNPSAKMGYNIDRFVEGVVTLGMGFRLNANVAKATVSVNGTEIVSQGKLV